MFFKLVVVNLLTLIRIIGTIILIPVYRIYGGFCVGIVSIFCYFTDVLDGILARHWNVSTFFGALFDGVADKLFTIINFVVLYLITPYAIIPIIFEVLTVLVQLFKYNKNYNIKSNMVGKTKVWILAICAFVTFLASDIDNIPLLPLFIKNTLSNTSYFVLLLPAIIMEALTFLSYLLEIFDKNNIKSKGEIQKEINKKSKNTKEHIKDIWLNPEFYDKHKNDSNLKDLRKMTIE